ncbi:ROK family transcriptional regulator [Devosia rhodophyticola]|uniref:ROK family transcriptional regulator n=1 Tax=Devosia rhodophyticola TaxID=3026423 RepID=A0ABY7Z041_9HYPH|nr:ROK family transcriptional regulator [Devosia rhodophyticola]WDR06944.1 ROK family transcriptional regulator [Devosia rhodophyticola]
MDNAPKGPVIREAGRAAEQIADHNVRVTLEAIRRDGALTRLELGHRSGLSQPGVSNIVSRLKKDGLIKERKRPNTGARPSSTEFAINPDGAFSIGIRLRANIGEAVLLDLSGRERNAIEFCVDAQIGTALPELPQRLHAGLTTTPRIVGVGIGMDTHDRLDRTTLAAALAPLPVFVQREPVAAVLAERTLGIGAVGGGLIYIIIGDTVRAGLMVRGVPFGGVHGRAGELGSMLTGVDRVPLESVVGLEALRARLDAKERAALASGVDIPISPAMHGWIKDAASHLLDAIIAAAGFLAPGAIMIGGDLPPHLINALIAQLTVERNDTAIRPFTTPWLSSVQPASFNRGGIALGAALLPFFDRLLPSPLPPPT